MYPFIYIALETQREHVREMRDAVAMEQLACRCRVAHPSWLDRAYSQLGDALIALGQWLKRRDPFPA